MTSVPSKKFPALSLIRHTRESEEKLTLQLDLSSGENLVGELSVIVDGMPGKMSPHSFASLPRDKSVRNAKGVTAQYRLKCCPSGSPHFSQLIHSIDSVKGC